MRLKNKKLFINQTIDKDEFYGFDKRERFFSGVVRRLSEIYERTLQSG